LTAPCIVPCGKAKAWDRYPDLGPVPAREAYTGPLAVATRRYAQRFHPCWFVLSAKHGLLRPDDLVPGPYEVSFSRHGDHVISDRELRDQCAALGLDGEPEVVVLAGRRYVARVRAALPNVRLHAPLAGQGLGMMLRSLARAVRDNVPLVGVER